MTDANMVANEAKMDSAIEEARTLLNPATEGAPKKTSRAASGSRSQRTPTAASQAEKRTISQLGDAVEAARPATRLRTALAAASGPEPTTAGGPSPHTDATAPLSSTGQDTVAALHSQDSAPLASRARTPEPVSMDAFLQAFQRLSPSKQQQFVESPAPVIGRQRITPPTPTSSAPASEAHASAHTAVQLGAGPFSSSPFAASGPAGPPRDNSASSSLPQGLTTTAALPAAHTGLSAASPPSHPMLTTPLAADGDAVGASGGTVFPTDDALGHFSGASMPGFPLGSSASPNPQHGAAHSLSGVEPRLLLGYDPEGTVGDIVQLPCQTTMNKVAASRITVPPAPPPAVARIKAPLSVKTAGNYRSGAAETSSPSVPADTHNVSTADQNRYLHRIVDECLVQGSASY
ncbi:unnamed protein product [Tilletia laevis]|uniref:Uncharacterized protein n=1 Tax=Tilletia laevis TaxID=157183 RepID=A0A9N8M7T7_9BASI|nr:unnamed protein product [Tilletia laevis]